MIFLGQRVLRLREQVFDKINDLSRMHDFRLAARKKDFPPNSKAMYRYLLKK